MVDAKWWAIASVFLIYENVPVAWWGDFGYYMDVSFRGVKTGGTDVKK